MSDLKPGDMGTVTKVEYTGEATRRLMDLGLHKGVSFKVIRKAPLGDPMEIKLKGTLMALRMKEAEQVSVQKENTAMGKQ
ncbi:MAG: FeoA family protein [bacterium]